MSQQRMSVTTKERDVAAINLLLPPSLQLTRVNADVLVEILETANQLLLYIRTTRQQ